MKLSTGELLEGLYVRDEDMVFRRLGEEMVLVPIRKGVGDFNSFYVLNEVGAFLWEKLAKPQSASSLVELIGQEFEVSLEEARQDLLGFLEDLRKLQALKLLSSNQKGENP